MSTQTIRPFVVSITVCLIACPSVAEETPQFPGPSPEHAFLKKFTGEWTTRSECRFSPNQPAMKCESSMKASMLGDLWVQCATKVTMAGHTVTAMQTIGYDPQQKKYVGTWIDSMSSHMWHYEGTVEGNTITLEAEGPNFMAGGKTALFRDIYEFISDDEIKATSQVQGEDGVWVTFSTGTAKRRQP